MGTGFLEINLFVADNALPVENVKVFIKDSTGKVLYELLSDMNGLTKKVSLYANDKEATLDPYSKAPRFSTYEVEAIPQRSYKKVMVHGVQIFDEETSILPIQLHPEVIGDPPEKNIDEYYIPIEHGVDLPHQFPTSLDMSEGYSFEATQVLPSANEVLIPEFITVHLGSPNAAARNVRVPFIDYIKNVASSEIFPTWEEAALYANIYCQISFALNRVYTVMD